MDRKPKFRSRKLEYNRPLQVYRFDEAIDIDDYDNPMRSVPLIATGVDKEEEEEHHLQVALTAAQVTPKDQSYMIPTPEAAIQISDYDKLYPSIFKQRKGFIRHTGTIEDLQFMQSKYILDSDDLKYLNFTNLSENSDKLKIFEHVMECFEDSANKFSEGIVSVDSSLDRIRNDSKLNILLEKFTNELELEAWLLYWKEKRRNSVCSLLPRLKFEDIGKIGSDPYVCFRRRELKQPRKTRRSDAQVMEKIKKIHYDLDTLRMMLEAGIKRDKFKKESFTLETNSFEKYWVLNTWHQDYGIERPPTLPSFKGFHQQVPYFPGPEETKSLLTSSTVTNNKKKLIKRNDNILNEHESGADDKNDFEDGEDDDDDGNEDQAGNMADLIRISIPPAAIKSVKYSRPYYPFEVVKQIQKDVETLLLNEDAIKDENLRDFTADLGSIERANREKLINFKFNLDEKINMIRNRHANDHNVLVIRRGRCGRLIKSPTLSTSNFVSPVLNQESFVLKERIFFPEAINHLRSIQARDCAHLNNAFVGNYNQHYIQCTSNLTSPTSLPSWISSTSGLLQNVNNNNSSSNNNKNGSTTKPTSASSSSGNNNTSPNKKKRPNEESDVSSNKKHKNPISAATTSTTESTISNLTASPQFTVKVKSKMDPLASSSSSGIDESDDLEAPVSVELVKKANAARFTPTGLQKESRLD